jgi:hypothetical protein
MSATTLRTLPCLYYKSPVPSPPRLDRSQTIRVARPCMLMIVAFLPRPAWRINTRWSILGRFAAVCIDNLCCEVQNRAAQKVHGYAHLSRACFVISVTRYPEDTTMKHF